MFTSQEPQVSLNGRYSITEASALLGIHRNTLRYYTNIRMIKCGYRRTTGRKFYLGSEILRFWKAQY